MRLPVLPLRFLLPLLAAAWTVMPGRVLAQEGRDTPPAASAPSSDAPVDPSREVRPDEVTDARIEGNRP